MGEGKWKDLAAVIAEDFSEEALRHRPQRLGTGFPRLDRLLDGGLAPGLTVLGGSPGLGKSTFALQLACRVAERGTPVLYFSLEMPRERVAAKAVSRQMFEAVRAQLPPGPVSREELRALGVTAAQLFGGSRGGRLTPEQRQLLERVRQAPLGGRNLYVIQDGLSAAGIRARVQAFRGERPGAVPLVIVDYLQILPADGLKAGNDRQVVEESLKHMVQIAHGGVPVLLLSSLNRGSYKAPMQLDAFKETGGIEYSADVLLGLQFSVCHARKDWDMNTEKNRLPRAVEVVVLKQRYGSSGGVVPLRYFAEFDYFEEGAVSPEEAEESGAAERVELPAVPGGAEAPAIQAEAPRPELQGPRRQPCYINNTKVANELRRGAFQPGPIRCRVMEQVTTEYELSAPLSGLEYAVADAVYTLFKSGRTSFSLRSVLQALSGDEGLTLTAQRRDQLDAAMKKLTGTRMRIDCTQLLRHQKKLEDGEERVIDGPFLSAAVEKGRCRLLDTGEATPLPLYTYGELSTRMVRFPPELLSVTAGGKKLTDTWENIALKRALIRRLEVVRHGGSQAREQMRTISFRENSALLLELGLSSRDYQSQASWEQRRRRLRQSAVQILKYYKTIGYVSGWDNLGDSVRLTGPIGDPWALTAGGTTE